MEEGRDIAKPSREPSLKSRASFIFFRLPVAVSLQQGGVTDFYRQEVGKNKRTSLVDKGNKRVGVGWHGVQGRGSTAGGKELPGWLASNSQLCLPSVCAPSSVKFSLPGIIIIVIIIFFFFVFWSNWKEPSRRRRRRRGGVALNPGHRAGANGDVAPSSISRGRRCNKELSQPGRGAAALRYHWALLGSMLLKVERYFTDLRTRPRRLSRHGFNGPTG